MIELHFVQHGKRARRIYHNQQVLLGPEGARVDEALPSNWDLPWSPDARLQIRQSDEGFIASNLTGDKAIQLNGMPLTSAPLSKGDVFEIGPLQIRFGEQEELPTMENEIDLQLSMEQLIEQMDEELQPSAVPEPELPKRPTRAHRRRSAKITFICTGFVFGLILTLSLLMALARTQQTEEERVHAILEEILAVGIIDFDDDPLIDTSYELHIEPGRLTATPKHHWLHTFRTPSTVVIEVEE